VNIIKSLGRSDCSYIPLNGGRNNSLKKVRCNNTQFILKKYKSNNADVRDRQRNEYLFINYAKSIGIKEVPSILEVDRLAGITLMSYIKGVKPCQKDLIRSNFIDSANFIVRLQDGLKNGSSAYVKLPEASENSINIVNSIGEIDYRIDKLLASFNYLNNDLKKIMLEYVEKEVGPFWREEKRKIYRNLDFLNNPIDRFVSPSDFGFHNTIINNTSMYFIDFEYSGFDDPTKLISDFRFQADYHISQDFFKVFYDIFLKKMDFRYDFEKRLSILSNMHKIRMSLIVLNPFINLKNDNIKQYKLCKQYFKSESIFFSEMFT